MATFAAVVTRPYWSTETWDTFADEPYVPGETPLEGNRPKGRIPVRWFVVMFKIPEPSLIDARPETERLDKVPSDVMYG